MQMTVENPPPMAWKNRSVSICSTLLANAIAIEVSR